MRHEVVHQGDKLLLTADNARLEVRIVRVQGGKVTLVIDSKNGPVECEIVPIHPGRLRGRHSRVSHRRQRPGTIGAEE